MKRKKAVTKKRANEGRGVKCRNCYSNMHQQLTVFSTTPDWMCGKCGSYHRRNDNGSWIWVNSTSTISQ